MLSVRLNGMQVPPLNKLRRLSPIVFINQTAKCETAQVSASR